MSQSLTEAERRARNLQAVLNVTSAINSSMDLDQTLNKVCQAAVELIGVDHSGLALFEDDLGSGKVRAEYPDLNARGLTIPLKAIPAEERLLASSEPVMITDVENEKTLGSVRGTLLNLDIRSILIVPVISSRGIVGSLSLDAIGHTRQFTDEEIEMCKVFAGHVAVALENARLLGESQLRLKRLEQVSSSVKEIISDLDATSLDERLDLIAKHAAQILEAQVCGIYLVKREGYLSSEASYGHSKGHFTKGLGFPIASGPGTGLTGYAAHTGKSLRVHGEDLLGHVAVRRVGPRGEVRRCFSTLLVPLKRKSDSRERVVGVLRAEDKKGKGGLPDLKIGFTEEDEWILKVFAEGVAAAIESAELVERLKQQKDQLNRLWASSPLGLIAINDKGKVTAFNEQAERIMKYQAEQVVGNDVQVLYGEPAEARRIGRLLHMDRNHRFLNESSTVKSSEGEVVPVRLSATWLYDAEKKRIGSVGYFEDLRSIKQKDRHLELLLNASNIISQATTMTEGLQALAEMMVSLLTSTFCRILLLDETGQFLIPKAAYPIPRPLSGELNWTPGVVPIAFSEYPGLLELMEGGRPRVLSYQEEEFRKGLARLSQRLGLEKELQSLLFIPLKIGKRLVGLLDVGEMRSDKRTSFTDEKVALASAIAAQITVLIDRTGLLEITRRRGQLLGALDEASRKIRAIRATPKLLQEVVRLAAELVGCTAGGLYINRPYIQQLELSVVHGLKPDFPPELMGSQVPHAKGLIGFVATTGKCKVIDDYCDWPEREPIFESYNFTTVLAIPIEQAGEVDAVLFVADCTGQKQFFKIDDIEVLERFAAQAAIALQASQLMSEEQRMTSQVSILHRISDYIQAADDLDKILHVVLTGVTADYGLRFNRAVMLLLDEQRENLVGRMGIGQFQEGDARNAWVYDDEHKLNHFARYLALLENGQLPQTPIGEWTGQLRLSVSDKAADAFSRAVFERRWFSIQPQELDQLPEGFVKPYNPTTRLVIVPLLARNDVIGLLIADNKFTQSPITDDDVNSLMTFASTAAIAIYNNRTLQQTLSGREKLLSFYQVSSELVALQDPATLRLAIVEQTHKAAEASWVSLLLIDEMGRAQNPITVGTHTHSDDERLIRSDGISMRVMRTGVAVAMEDITKQQKDFVNPVMLRGNTRAAVCLPLSLPGKRIGVMWIHYDKSRSFPAFERAALQLYVNQAAIAYESARRMKTLEDMRKAADALAGADDLAQVLEQIVQSAREVLQADSAVLWFYDAEEDNFILEASVAAGIQGQSWNELRKAGPSRRGTAYHVMSNEWVPVGDVADEQQNQMLGETTRKLLSEIGARGFQGSVLSVGDEKLGVLYATYNFPCSFGVEERETALTFANHAALALKKARLLDQLKKARRAAAAVAKVTALGDRKATLTSIAKETMNAVGCDAVVLFEYDRTTRDLVHPPTMEGVWFPEKAMSSEEVLEYSIVRQMLERDEPYPVHQIADDPDFKDRRFARDEKTKSCVAIPLRAGLEKVGVMFVNYRRLRRFTKDDLDDIELFANQAAVALRNAQLFEASSKQLREQEALVQLSKELLGTLTLKETMNSAVRVAADVLGIEYCNIVLPDENNELIFRAAFGWDESMVDTFKLGRWKGSQTGYTIETKSPIRVNDYAKEKRFEVAPLVFEKGLKSGLSVPMFRGGDVIGAMLVHTMAIRHFSDAEERTLSLIANDTAIAMQSAQQYEASMRKSAHLRALYEASKEITASFGFDRTRVLDQILRQAVVGITGLQGPKAVLGTMQVFDEHKNELVFESVYPSEEYPGLVERIGERRSLDKNKVEDSRIGITGRAVLERTPQLILHVTKDVDYLLFNESTQSELAVPLLDQDRVLGVLNVESDLVGGFDIEDQSNLQALAELAVIAVKNAKQYEELRRTKGMVGARTALAWMGMASNHWRHRIEAQAADIRNNVELIWSKNDNASAAEKLPSWISEDLRQIKNQAKKIMEKSITPPLSSEEGVTDVNVNQLIHERLEQLWKRVPYNFVTLGKPSPHAVLIVRISSEWLRRAVDILVDNAVKEVKELDSERRSVSVSIRSNGEQVEIEVADKGRGIPESIIENIFKRQIEKLEVDKGLGMGLLMAQAIVETYRGTLRIENSGPSGTSMVIRLPQRV